MFLCKPRACKNSRLFFFSVTPGPHTIRDTLGLLQVEGSSPTTICSTLACREAVHTLFVSLWNPSNSRGRFQPLFAARSPAMMRSTHYLRHSGTPPIRGVDPNHYLQHNRVPRGDPHTICVTLGSLKSEGAIPTTIYSTFASSEALQTSIAKARRAPRVLHFFVFPAPQWNGGLRAPKKAISRRYGGRTDFCGRTDGRHPQKSPDPGPGTPGKIRFTNKIWFRRIGRPKSYRSELPPQIPGPAHTYISGACLYSFACLLAAC